MSELELIKCSRCGGDTWDMVGPTHECIKCKHQEGERGIGIQLYKIRHVRRTGYAKH